MPVPKYRTSRSKKGMRRSHHALKVPSWSQCSRCNHPKMIHEVCPGCGMYKEFLPEPSAATQGMPASSDS